ncbi:hypothetical protein M408DRAFT_168853 [Serendipita vermifera MAFF 305830]|uniref:Uncharacterized protein n=1 Tax=Serendipita vermifera MAFF 305830 TaxID=933852 RepID=A0A0C3A5I6_SERVB|nr:hypothetical protein M408DRAFT_168853 [Serendipita vermifera MAFF 305830]
MATQCSLLVTADLLPSSVVTKVRYNSQKRINFDEEHSVVHSCLTKTTASTAARVSLPRGAFASSPITSKNSFFGYFYELSYALAAQGRSGAPPKLSAQRVSPLGLLPILSQITSCCRNQLTLVSTFFRLQTNRALQFHDSSNARHPATKLIRWPRPWLAYSI